MWMSCWPTLFGALALWHSIAPHEQAFTRHVHFIGLQKHLWTCCHTRVACLCCRGVSHANQPSHSQAWCMHDHPGCAVCTIRLLPVQCLCFPPHPLLHADCPIVPANYSFYQAQNGQNPVISCAHKGSLTEADIAQLCNANPNCNSFVSYRDWGTPAYCLSAAIAPGGANPLNMPDICEGFYRRGMWPQSDCAR
jgi:hypothetical protein